MTPRSPHLRCALIFLVVALPSLAAAQSGFSDITDRVSAIAEWLEQVTWIVAGMSVVFVAAKFWQGDAGAFRQSAYWMGSLAALMAARGILDFFRS